MAETAAARRLMKSRRKAKLLENLGAGEGDHAETLGVYWHGENLVFMWVENGQRWKYLGKLVTAEISPDERVEQLARAANLSVGRVKRERRRAAEQAE